MASVTVTITKAYPIRSGPSFSFPKIGTTSVGQTWEITKIEQVGDLYYGRMGNGDSWILMSTTSITNEQLTLLNPVNTNAYVPPTTVSPVTTETLTTSSQYEIASQDPILLELIKNTSNSYNKRNSLIGSTRLFAIPHQFTPETDLRTAKGIDLGRKYMEAIISEAPLVTILPGRPSYLPDLSAKDRETITTMFSSFIQDTSKTLDQILDSVLLGKNQDVRYFSFMWDYFEYMKYVDLLCSATAILLQLDTEQTGFDIGGTHTPYYKFNWKNYRFNKILSQEENGKVGAFTDEKKLTESISKVLREGATTIASSVTSSDPNYVQFYMEPPGNMNETMGNNTGQSGLQGILQTGESAAKELAFVMNASAATGLANFKEGIQKNLDELSKKYGNQNFFTRILGAGNAILSGSNIIFPEIWNDSSFSKNYNITINLISPYGTKEAIYLNIFVPLMHLIALVLPRQTGANSFAAPFLVKVFSKGLFNCEMGIVDSLSIDKGGGGDGWSADGFPTEVKVTLSIKDLYSHLSMTKDTEVMNFLNNQSLMEFLAVNCGVELTKPELMLKVDMMKKLIFNYATDIPTTLFENVITELRQSAFQWWYKLTSFTR